MLVAEDFTQVLAPTAANFAPYAVEDFARVVAPTAVNFAPFAKNITPYAVEDFVQTGPLAVFAVLADALKMMAFVIENVGSLVNLYFVLCGEFELIVQGHVELLHYVVLVSLPCVLLVAVV